MNVTCSYCGKNNVISFQLSSRTEEQYNYAKAVQSQLKNREPDYYPLPPKTTQEGPTRKQKPIHWTMWKQGSPDRNKRLWEEQMEEWERYVKSQHKEEDETIELSDEEKIGIATFFAGF